MPIAKIAPSMLSSDFANLASEADRMIQCGADWLHMDIMFATRNGWVGWTLSSNHNILALVVSGYQIYGTTGLAEMFGLFSDILYQILLLALLSFKALESTPSNILLPLCFTQLHGCWNLLSSERIIVLISCRAYLDCHLMVTNPLDYVEPLGKAGASGFTFHVEASKDNWQELVQQIKLRGMKPGVALKPGTPVEEVYPLLDGENPVEMVLVMTVEPGFGGQKFMLETMEKVRDLRKKYPSLDIEASPSLTMMLQSPKIGNHKTSVMFDIVMQVDGGLGPSTIDAAASAGANCIVAGSSVFGAPEPAQVISLMRKSVEVAH
ncbi:hypothetical protein RHGRI_028096 [Rhododendron griersonianum]|uniref:ribulose-phosphate 3-epimerase n=1 Tax=Rhododendron griersonianum TaxID=479676 RepID=A0AAV6IK16_9ERIC|nr:hypothetical protein RHGRI_028096 [Rhododendron griersonianum]